MTQPLPSSSSSSNSLQHREETATLGDAIAELASRIQAATYELLVMLREFDAREGWGPGCASCTHWLNWRTGIALGAAREKVRVARALGDLPHLSAAMRRGAISFSNARAITRGAGRQSVPAAARLRNGVSFVAVAPTVYVKSGFTQAWRRTIEHRRKLVAERTRDVSAGSRLTSAAGPWRAGSARS